MKTRRRHAGQRSESRLQAVSAPDRLKAELQTGVFKHALKSICLVFAAALFCAALPVSVHGEPQTNRTPAHVKFRFGQGKIEPGWTRVRPADLYGAQTGFGFEPGASLVVGSNCITSGRPFFFSLRLPEGNYLVTVTLGDAVDESDNTIKAELRRLMVESVKTAKGKTAKRIFTVNIRTAEIPGGGAVRLKERERTTEMVNWDDKLTLEFNGPRPCLHSLEIAPDNVPTVFLLGDSTVCDQPREPWNSWGQMLPRFFKPDVAVANHAESGESISLNASPVCKVIEDCALAGYLLPKTAMKSSGDK